MFILTDGSTQSSFTSDFHVPAHNETRSHRSPHNMSSTSAELFGTLQAAICIAADRVIYPGSYVALDSLIQCSFSAHYYSLSCAVVKALTNASPSGHRVQFQWIPSYAVIDANEIADRLAADAHTLNLMTHFEFALFDVKTFPVNSAVRLGSTLCCFQ